MGKTIIEKIIQAHSDEAGEYAGEVEAGKIVWMRLDARTARDFGGANVVKNYQTHYGKTPVDDPTKTFFTFDLVTPANNIPYAINQQACRDWAKEQGVKVFDVDMGIGSHVAIEHGMTWPGSTFVGTDSHLNILGAIGAFGQGMGDQDIAFTFKTGKTWFEVPYTMKVTIRGDLKSPCTPKDLTLACLRRLGASGALGQAVEFYGPAIDALDLSGRITLASMMTEMGGIIGLIPPSEEVLAYCRQRTGRDDLVATHADADASYTQVIEIDITNLEPL
jgi:3-isopropylmalate/(R)-2-methylmalate dehydratase large subunit